VINHTPFIPEEPRTSSFWRKLLFVILGAILFGGLALAAFLLAGPRLNDIAGRGGPEWTPPAYSAITLTPRPSGGEAPTAAPQPTAGPASPAGLRQGQKAVVLAGAVNLRVAAGLNAGIIIAIPNGQTVDLIEGPHSADNVVWWKVKAGEQEGWMAERSASGQNLLGPQP